MDTSQDSKDRSSIELLRAIRDRKEEAIVLVSSKKNRYRDCGVVKREYETVGTRPQETTLSFVSSVPFVTLRFNCPPLRRQCQLTVQDNQRGRRKSTQNGPHLTDPQLGNVMVLENKYLR
ncbi:uncharacterized protein LOC143305345 [Osmia lignaria lignaria]|uniref:uncharacterized protein LOC143305345 n=1 Tax=Osmia lignaria lignaria TaxID=1437193 RepID=UPI00402B6A7D